MEDSFSRIDTSLLYQPFFKLLKACYADLEGQGLGFVAVCGLRTWAEQDALYAIGRTTGKTGHYVTKARGGYSPHNFSVAVDGCHDADLAKPGLQPDYGTDSVYRTMADCARTHGLEPGYYWTFKDSDHLQLPLRKFGITWAQLRQVYGRGGYPHLFSFLDHFNW